MRPLIATVIAREPVLVVLDKDTCEPYTREAVRLELSYGHVFYCCPDRAVPLGVAFPCPVCQVPDPLHLVTTTS